MNKIYEKSSTDLIESDLNFHNLVETTYCLLKAYIIWMYTNFIRISKIDKFITLVKVFICNVKTRIYNNYSQRKNLLAWIQTKVKKPISVTNFKEDWKDGIALCALIEGIIPGSCPRYDLLTPENALENLNLGIFLVKKHLNIDSPIESQEIHDCKEEAKFVYLLSKIKFEAIKLFMKSLLKRPIINLKDSLGNSHKMFESLFGDQNACFAKGMGLILGVRTRKARFNIFCKPSSKLNLMIEISGPNNTMCSERIITHNPRKRVSADVVTTSLVADYLSRKKSCEDILKIPFFYEVFPNRIVVTYIPLMKGIHKLSVIWQGQHILHSPYTVKVEDCDVQEISERRNSGVLSQTKFIPGLPIPAFNRSDSVSLEECATVVRRKVIKQTVVVNGRQQSLDYFNHISDKINEKTQTDDNLQDFEFKNYDKSIDTTKSSNSPKIEEFLSNGFNRKTNLFDIKECDSLHSENVNENDLQIKQNNQNIDNKLDIIQDNKTEKFDDLSGNKTNDIITKSDENPIISKNQQNNKKSSNYQMNHNISYRSYIPVKSMIKNWEIKSMNNINENNGNTFERSSSKIPCILVKNRRQIFEKNIPFVNRRNSDETDSISNSSHSNDNRISSDVIISEIENNQRNVELCDQTIEDENQNSESKQKTLSKCDSIENESEVKTPESLTDSGVCAQFSDLSQLFKTKLCRRRSLSYPNLRSLDKSQTIDVLNDENCDKLNDTQNSIISGQYIDDEIPEYSNLLLGNYISYTGLLNNENPVNFDDIHLNHFLDNENDLNVHNDKDLGIYPEKCEVFGAGAYYGQVGAKNRFVVSTKDGGRSFLSVGVQSTESDDVLEVSFTSIGQNRYEVHYEVSRPGYYVIFVKWGDYNIADSPFICKVTY